MGKFPEIYQYLNPIQQAKEYFLHLTIKNKSPNKTKNIGYEKRQITEKRKNKPAAKSYY